MSKKGKNMKKLSPFIALLISGCALIPFAGPGEISGKDAKKLIIEASNQNTLVSSAIALSAVPQGCSTLYRPGTANYESCVSQLTSLHLLVVVLASKINEALVPVLTGIKDNKIYRKDTVDLCVDKVKTLGFIVPFPPEVLCNVEEVNIIQLGPIEL